MAPQKGKDKATESPPPTLDMSDSESVTAHSEDESTTADKEKDSGTPSDTPALPLQKRRRVTRACDECRRKKIKCDGKQPCTHCQVYSYECTYDKPSNRRRNPAPQYIEALENRLQRAEALLKKFMPDLDLADPAMDPAVEQEFRLREQARAKAIKKEESAGPSSAKTDERLLSMISGVGQLEFDDKGDYDFHGPSSGTVFFRKMKDHFKSLLGRDYHVPVLPRPPKPSSLNLDSPRLSAAGSPASRKGSVPDIVDLPPKVVARRLCSHSLKYATCLLRVVHVPTFYSMVDRIYERNTGGYHGENDDRELALLYSVLALGCMYNVLDDEKSKKPPYEVATEQGLKYYTSARFLLQDITDCRDLTSLQALLFMILFIQSISNLSTCYGFVGIALRSALRMGLHRNLPHTGETAIDAETRRRVFSVCRQLDIYVSALLGFPMLLNEEDIDQPLPTPVDDEFITKAGIVSVPPGTTSFFEAFNAHARLMDILSKVIKFVYPLKGIEQSVAEGGQMSPSYVISYTKVKELEASLQEWNEALPVAWKPDSEGPEEVVRVRNLLRFAFAHVQMVLYRPFLHAVSPKMTAGKQPDDRSYACGAAGINVARNIIHIGIEMRKQVSLVGPYWFTLFTEFFAIITLVFYVLENVDKPGTSDIMADAAAGRDMIAKIARRSVAADRISKALDVLFEQLPPKMKKVSATSTPSKKRSATGSKESLPATISSPSSHNPAMRSTDAMDGMVNGIRGSLAPMAPGLGFDLDTNFGLDDFSSNMQGMSPLDLAANAADAMAAGHLDHGRHMQQDGLGQGLNQINQLDAVMFPSGDPLAYPNQPGLGMRGGPQHYDPSQYYAPNLFDGIEGQLMGPLPPYLMQTPQGQPGFSFPAQMYSDPMLAIQLQRAPQQHQPHGHHQMPQQRRRMFNQFGAQQSWSGGMFPQ
ncbi:hypothetical protein G7054_g8263 [Neopestalotiopsis clavispora]|nr:hypothetical protein G7054_g8263 [Neopestalotiopsis clavispora]